mmetsp:Transcript_13856/g.27621  ORF Transcript_13856/g.27621 Transcript_13856/m.27621 type:complete len:118 (+) Transcript_13856:4647-5000(+)
MGKAANVFRSPDVAEQSSIILVFAKEPCCIPRHRDVRQNVAFVTVKVTRQAVLSAFCRHPQKEDGTNDSPHTDALAYQSIKRYDAPSTKNRQCKQTKQPRNAWQKLHQLKPHVVPAL